MLLTRGMFGTATVPIEHFGIFCGQMRSGESKLGHNCGWYNREGEKLGWGDISAYDFRVIQAGIPQEEFFILLPELKSFAAFVKYDGPVISEIDPREQHPGKDYVAQHFKYAITRSIIYLPLTYPYTKPGEVVGRVSKLVGCTTIMIMPEDFRNLL